MASKNQLPIQQDLWSPMDMMIIDAEVSEIAREALPAINHCNTHDRRAIYAPSKIFSRLVGQGAGSREEKWEMDGLVVKAQLGRLFTFRNSQSCSECGIEGKFFLMERHVNETLNGGYSLVLYALDRHSNLVALTADHILPDSLGGRYSTSNFQTMCKMCNQSKAHLMSQAEIDKIRANVGNHAKDWVNLDLLHELLNLREACLRARTGTEEADLHALFESARKHLAHGGSRVKQQNAINTIRIRLTPPTPEKWYVKLWNDLRQQSWLRLTRFTN